MLRRRCRSRRETLTSRDGRSADGRTSFHVSCLCSYHTCMPSNVSIPPSTNKHTGITSRDHLSVCLHGRHIIVTPLPPSLSGTLWHSLSLSLAAPERSTTLIGPGRPCPVLSGVPLKHSHNTTQHTAAQRTPQLAAALTHHCDESVLLPVLRIPLDDVKLLACACATSAQHHQGVPKPVPSGPPQVSTQTHTHKG